MRPTLREALETCIHYLRLHNEGLLLSLEAIGDVLIWKSELVAGHGSPVRQAMELTVGVEHRFIRQLRGVAWRSRPVWFSHSAPANMTRHLRVFGPWVEFGRDCNGILLEPGDLDAALPAADPAMVRHVKLYLEPMLAQTGVTVSDQVRRLVYELLASGHASVERVASRLGMSRKTLYRHLVIDGETFSAIVDSVRTDMAPRYVDDAGQSLTQVAELLGFSASSAFSRWFAAKFGCSPMP
jgi:AraC-like DNA-binding protein